MTILDILIVVSCVVGMVCLMVFSVLWLFINIGVPAGIIGFLVSCGVIYRSGYRDWETDRKSTRLNSSHSAKSRMPSSA